MYRVCSGAPGRRGACRSAGIYGGGRAEVPVSTRFYIYKTSRAFVPPRQGPMESTGEEPPAKKKKGAKGNPRHQAFSTTRAARSRRGCSASRSTARRARSRSRACTTTWMQLSQHRRMLSRGWSGVGQSSCGRSGQRPRRPSATHVAWCDACSTATSPSFCLLNLFRCLCAFVCVCACTVAGLKA